MRQLSENGQGVVVGKRVARIYLHTAEGAAWYLGVVGKMLNENEPYVDVLCTYDPYTWFQSEPSVQDLAIYSFEQKIGLDTQTYQM